MNRLFLIFVFAVLQCIAVSDPPASRAQDAPSQVKPVIGDTRPGQDFRQGWEETRDHLVSVVRRLGRDKSMIAAIEQLKKAASKREFEVALKPLTLLRVSINPESRVKLQAVQTRIRLINDQPQVFFIAVENTAGITAPLSLSTIDLATDPPRSADWCTVEVVDTSLVSRFFTGKESEYKLMRITPHVSGLREIRIVGDAGQGTQDLGFRATADVLMDIKTTRYQ